MSREMQPDSSNSASLPNRFNAVVVSAEEEGAASQRFRPDAPTTRGAHAHGPRALTMRFLLYAVLFVFAIWYLTPIYILLVTSLKGSSEVTLDKMWALPTSFNLDSFDAAWKALAPNFLNSLLLAIPAAIISSIFGSLNGYVLAKWKFRGADTLFLLILFGMFIPYQAILIPLTRIMTEVGLYGSIPGLILVHVIYGIPITTLIFRNFYSGIPTELLEAAKVDGAGFFRIYRSILVPLSVSGFVVVLIWQFNSVWNDFLFAVTLTTPNNWPVTVALNNLSGSFIATWNVQMAGALIAATPTLVIFIVLGRYFVRGLLAGSLKG
jgi:glucose/mannose transport system permease protein